jgi:hypothetical protein
MSSTDICMSLVNSIHQTRHLLIMTNDVRKGSKAHGHLVRATLYLEGAATQALVRKPQAARNEITNARVEIIEALTCSTNYFACSELVYRLEELGRFQDRCDQAMLALHEEGLITS